KPREFRHSMALCATPATRAQPELSISPRNPSVRILWSSTRATLIGPSIPDKFQFHMRFGALFAGGDLHFPLEGRHPLADVPKAHALHRGLGVKTGPIVLYGKGNAVLLLDQLHIDLGGLGVLQGVVDQFMDAAIDHNLQFAR